MRQLMNTIVAVVACGSTLLLCERVKGEGRSDWLSSAVDVHGIRHQGNQYPGRAPWMKRPSDNRYAEIPLQRKSSAPKGFWTLTTHA